MSQQSEKEVCWRHKEFFLPSYFKGRQEEENTRVASEEERRVKDVQTQ